MHLFLIILCWAFAAGSLIFATYWSIVLWRIVRARRAVPTIQDGLEACDSGASGRVSIIVPAHNEAAVIEACARSLLEQDYDDIELIFVLDRCTDDTRHVLERAVDGDPRVRIIEIDNCPDGWAGKCNASRSGASEARGEWLIFTDADTVHAPYLVRAAIGMAAARSLDLLSLLSTLSTGQWYERVVQPVASMNLLRLFPVERVNRPDSKRKFANGQFMLFRRSLYDTIGGHEAVRDALLEDIALARKIHASGGRVGIFFDGGALRVTMYESFDAFRTGWKRIFIEACKRRVDRLRKNAARMSALCFGEPLVYVGTLATSLATVLVTEQLAAPVVGVSVVLVGVLLKLTSLVIVYRASGTPLRAIIMYDIGGWHVSRIFREAASDLELRTPIRWAGRTYILEPRHRV